MSKDEAIKIIEDACWWYHKKGCSGLTQAEIFEARDMAIKALSQEPCDDTVSREYLKKIAQSEGAYGYVSAHDIATAPSVTQKSGKWDASCTCSVCGQWRILESEKNSGKYKFCPNCGAKMESEEQTE